MPYNLSNNATRGKLSLFDPKFYDKERIIRTEIAQNTVMVLSKRVHMRDRIVVSLL